MVLLYIIIFYTRTSLPHVNAVENLVDSLHAKAPFSKSQPPHILPDHALCRTTITKMNQAPIRSIARLSRPAARFLSRSDVTYRLKCLHSISTFPKP